MKSNLYTLTIPPMVKSMESLIKILDKAFVEVSAKATERRPASYFEKRLLDGYLIFDQFPLLMQIQRVSDNAKGGAARLAGIEIPAFEDNEKTIAELQARLKKTTDFVKSVSLEQIVGHEDRHITLPYPSWSGKYVTTFEYATEYLMPNFYFHYATAYSILRKNGIDVGKDDYIGGLPLKDRTIQ